MLAFQIPQRIYFSFGGAAGHVSVKKTHKNVWVFTWCRVWITANNLKPEMGKCLAGAALYRYRWFINMDIFGETDSIFRDFKALGNDSSMFR